MAAGAKWTEEEVIALLELVFLNNVRFSARAHSLNGVLKVSPCKCGFSKAEVPLDFGWSWFPRERVTNRKLSNNCTQ